jgi:rfaE bifunctional protein kinase chain/domain
MTLSWRRPPSPARLKRSIDRFRGTRALVWGDFVLDEYWRCRTARVSREAPVLVLEYQERTVQGGGAAHAALTLAALGARVAVVGWAGDDAAGAELRAMFEGAGIDARGLLTHPRAATVVKTRIVAGDSHTARQQVVRVDRGHAFALAAPLRARLDQALATASRGARAIVLSDYGYDAVTPALARERVRAWRADGAVVGVDARYRLAGYRGATLATPNEGEAAAAAGLDIAGERDLAAAARSLRKRMDVAHLVVTRGRDGLTLWSGRESAALAAWGGKEAVDVTGAGDAVVSAATLALAVGASPLEASAIANVAGSVAVSRRGAVPVKRAELVAALGRA